VTRRLLPLLAAALLAPAAARAEATGGCHCFRDRAFDPERPAAADPYVLATTRSSLLSAAYGIDKGSLVRAVMTGSAPEDLWIAQWAGARAGRPAAQLLAAREERGSWAGALAGATGLGAPFEAALAAGGEPAALAALAVDDVLVHRLGADPRALAALRAAGATTEEAIVAAVLARHLQAPTAPLVAEVHAGRATWGGVLKDAGLAPRDLDPLVRRLVK
jgi:hypothetical protein